MAGNRSSDGPSAEVRLPMWTAWVCLVAAVALIATAAGLYAGLVPNGVDLVHLEWAGSSAKAVGAVHSLGAFRAGVRGELVALIFGTFGLLLACYLGRWVFWTRRPHFLVGVGMAAAIGVALLTAAQDGLLLIVLGDGLRGGWIFRSAEALSLAAFSALLVAAIVAIVALATTMKRLIVHHWIKERWRKVLSPGAERGSGDDKYPVIPPPRIEAPAPRQDGPDWWKRLIAAGRPALVDGQLNRSWWDQSTPAIGLGTPARTHWAQGFASPKDWKAGGTGICVSGGGIRSASVTLGALQALREKGILGDADYLVSVSGGGYTAGALQLATQPNGGSRPGAAAGSAKDVFDRGSAEEDYLRRHSSYIADGLREWVTALAVLFRGVLSSMVVIGLAITTLGLGIGGFYSYVPIVDDGKLDKLRPLFLVPGQRKAPGFPAVPPGVLIAIGCAGTLAVVAYLAQLTAVPVKRPGPVPEDAALARLPERWFSRMARAFLAATAVLATIGVVLPAVLWASSWLTWHLGFSIKSAPAAGSALSLSVVLSYVGTLAATLWRNSKKITSGAGNVLGSAKKTVSQVLPNSMIQMVIIWICLALLILLALLACGWAATSGLVNSWWALLPVGALALVYLLADQTSFSLHPFYRRRLARAFAVRRDAGVARPYVARPYSEREMTWLHKYGGRPEKNFPGVTFNATANITGQDRTPPGRRAVPFTLAHDYIGGPQTGWVRTDVLCDLTASHLQADLTVEAAMAISGAAFASAMGSQTRFYEVFLALSNARLGAWLPNPYFVALKAGQWDNWTIPGLPGRRRLGYFAREIFGLHPSTGRLILCTDGGHYDNLGLVELLRRRCKRIYCFDASGAAAPLDDTLSGAMTLAREELGVEISRTDKTFGLVAGSGRAMSPAGPFTDLNKRLAKSTVMTARTKYPEGAFAGDDAELVFAQAILTPDMPYQLLDFPQDNPGFPWDSTADQWFNAAQFDAYQHLGDFIGHAAAVRSTTAPATPPGVRPTMSAQNRTATPDHRHG